MTTLTDLQLVCLVVVLGIAVLALAAWAWTDL